jgi:hypothetical protein
MHELACECQVWNLKPHVRLAVDPMLARLELADKPTIGFHVRGGDKLQEDKIGCAAAPSVQGRPAAALHGRASRPDHASAVGQPSLVRITCAGTARPRWRTTTSPRSWTRSGAWPGGGM